MIQEPRRPVQGRVDFVASAAKLAYAAIPTEASFEATLRDAPQDEGWMAQAVLNGIFPSAETCQSLATFVEASRSATRPSPRKRGEGDAARISVAPASPARA